jgi:surfeit locus 1 family protein
MAVAAALVCVRLGFWQLHRLEQRRARNALVSGRFAADAVNPSQLPHDTAAARFMRVRVAGVPDYAHELILPHERIRDRRV